MANGVLDCYGETPHYLTINPAAANWVGTGFELTWPGTTPLATSSALIRPWTTIATANAPQARVNRQVLFRRALKLVNGGVLAGVSRLPTDGLTVVSENPVYVQGNYNATNDPVVNADRGPRAGIHHRRLGGDPLEQLDRRRLVQIPRTTSAGRQATTTGYRFAVVTGKSLSFPYPTAGTPEFLFGTDGGAGNFLRMMEDWNNGVDLNYRGSMVSLFISRQATGTFKYDGDAPCTTTRTATSSSTTSSCSRRCCRRAPRCSAT